VVLLKLGNVEKLEELGTTSVHGRSSCFLLCWCSRSSFLPGCFAAGRGGSSCCCCCFLGQGCIKDDYDSISSLTILTVGFAAAVAAGDEDGLFSFLNVVIASKVAARALLQVSVGKSRSTFATKGGIRIRRRPL
jgi:hypothetical protein